MTTDQSRLAVLAALNEPMRHRLYEYVVGQDAPTSRDEAAAALGIARSVAAFHLDKLTELGLLEADYHRLPGRSGPGAGRPTKWYKRAEAEFEFSVPERHYELAATLMARAIERCEVEGISIDDALRIVAREHGSVVGSRVRPSEGDFSQSIGKLSALLAEHGYEPRVTDGVISLANCPFHTLAEEHRSLMCGMNLELLSGVLEATGLPPTAARLDPAPGRCCVTLSQ